MWSIFAMTMKSIFSKIIKFKCKVMKMKFPKN